jgi:NADH dehydrogenase
MGDGKSKFQPVPVESVAAAFVKALTEPRAVNQIFDLCGSEVLTLDEIVDATLAALDRRRLKVHVPLPLARVQAAALEFGFPVVLRKATPLNRDQLRMLQEDNTGNAEAATALFGLKYPTFREGIARYLRVSG